MKYLQTLFLCIFLFFFAACTKNKLGGKCSIKGSVMHHSRTIANARVFIKLKATEFPGADTTIYDSNMLSDSLGAYSFKCYPGNYYLYSIGYDTQLLKKVSGGTPVTVRANEVVLADIAVTE